ncbi:hypothetical protein MXB_469, partial [Myxobolus squamalis]
YSQHYLDKCVPYLASRWIFTLLLIIFYNVRVLVWPVYRFFVVTYVVSLFALNLFIGFISPRVDPVLNADDGMSLPTGNDEFRPFVRKLPEFKFWLKLTISYIIAFTCSLFDFFDIPVFWPILLFYFFMLAFITLKNQFEHMIRYGYFPMDFGKKKYISA